MPGGDAGIGGVHIRFKPARVLVVDDESSRSIIRELLENCGLFVMEAQYGVAAELIASEVNPDLILLSDTLPDMSTAEVTKGIRNKLGKENIRIVGGLISALRDEGTPKYFDDVFIKPISEGGLMEVLERFLDVEERIVDEAYAIPIAGWAGGIVISLI